MPKPQSSGDKACAGKRKGPASERLASGNGRKDQIPPETRKNGQMELAASVSMVGTEKALERIQTERDSMRTLIAAGIR